MSSSLSLVNEQARTKNEVNYLLKVQESVDQLRGQLWIFLQYSDNKSLIQVQKAQTNLDKLLADADYKYLPLENLSRINRSLRSLVKQEQLYWSKNTQVAAKEGLEILHSRYNMIIQNMSEEVLFLVRQKVVENTAEQAKVVWLMGIKLVVFTLVVFIVSWLIYVRFLRGSKTLKYAFFNLARGRFDHEISATGKLDSEFMSLIHMCNQMRESITKITVKRDELQSAVDKQTEELLSQREELFHLANHDDLTSLLNRRAFELKSKQLLSNVVEENHQLAVLFVDIDEFKAINDTYGHDAGDEVIRVVATRLLEQCRHCNCVGRLGGDEFVACVDLNEVDGVFEQKLMALKSRLEQDVLFEDISIEVRVSIGIALYPEHGQSIEELIKIADKSMYSEKKLIRNALS
ncbi:GGDEF domain-containing protein [Vibrio sp.]|nr:GGDEF domain-containing protein [Vibrio sp.]